MCVNEERGPKENQTSSYQNGQTLFFSDSCSDVNACLPVAGRQVLDGPGRTFQGFGVRAVGQQVEIKLHDLKKGSIKRRQH